MSERTLWIRLASGGVVGFDGDPATLEEVHPGAEVIGWDGVPETAEEAPATEALPVPEAETPATEPTTEAQPVSGPLSASRFGFEPTTEPMPAAEGDQPA